jgi:hypothetical protein
LEAGSVWKAKLKRIEKNNAKLYLVLDKKRDEDWWGWIVNRLFPFFAPSFGWIIYKE